MDIGQDASWTERSSEAFVAPPAETNFLVTIPFFSQLHRVILHVWAFV